MSLFTTTDPPRKREQNSRFAAHNGLKAVIRELGVTGRKHEGPKRTTNWSRCCGSWEENGGVAWHQEVEVRRQWL